jgi:hypothetical protein
MYEKVNYFMYFIIIVYNFYILFFISNSFFYKVNLYQIPNHLHFIIIY